jgi:hypothetical protein
MHACTHAQAGDQGTLLIDGNNWVKTWLDFPPASPQRPDVLSKPLQDHLDHAREEIRAFLNHAFWGGWMCIHVFFDWAKVQDYEIGEWWGEPSRKRGGLRGSAPTFTGWYLPRIMHHHRLVLYTCTHIIHACIPGWHSSCLVLYDTVPVCQLSPLVCMYLQLGCCCVPLSS